VRHYTSGLILSNRLQHPGGYCRTRVCAERSLTPATFTTADVHVITQRNRQGSPGPIICTEPSPDVARALSAAAAATAQGGNAGTTGSFGAGGASAEAVLALAGRSTALLGLRDGLYRACEAYANGAISADAYALVLSRYGQLMTTLFLGQDVTGAAGTAAGGSVQSPPVSVTINPSGASAVTAGAQSPPPATQQLPGTQTASSTDNSAVALTRMNEDYMNLDYNLAHLLTVSCINEYDPTRAGSNSPKNPWLKDICDNMNIPSFAMLASGAKDLVRYQLLAPPVNPAAVTTPAAQNKQPAKAATASA